MAPPTLSDGRFQELVTKGIEWVKDIAARKWDLGDAALEIAPMGKDGVNNGNDARMREYAEKIGIEFDTLDAYRKVAGAWKAVTRVPAASWSAHREMMAPDQQKVLIKLAQDNPGKKLTVDFLRKHRGIEPTRHPSLSGDPEAAAEILIKTNPDAVGKALAKAEPKNVTKVSTTAYREARYPGLSDDEIVKLDQLDDQNRQKVEDNAAPIRRAVANIGAIMWLDPLIKFHQHVVTLVSEDATLDSSDVEKARELVRKIDDELAVYTLRHGRPDNFKPFEKVEG